MTDCGCDYDDHCGNDALHDGGGDDGDDVDVCDDDGGGLDH